ncbi:MAG TPA: sulfatase-like hydrolase/transferase [Anaerolineales bacterium]|nr:sulfatase-like hydrolase/transferase [Anaerolineales bacterium]
MADRPNILLIMGEDHGAWALGAAGNREIRTPTLDYLAETGVQMDNAFTPTPVCSPSRACLLTGRLASQHGIHDYLGSGPDIDAIDWLGAENTLPQLLRGNGYQTALIGKWHLGRDAQPQGGFEHWVCHSFDYPFEHGGPHRYSIQGEIHTLDGYKTQILTDFAVDFLRERDTERPFFLFVSHTATHSPWSGHPERLVQAYRGCDFSAAPQDPSPPGAVQNLESTNATREQPHEALAQYYAAVTEMDEGVGRLLDELEALGLRETTLVVYLSDHGLNCGQHGIWGKGNGTLPLNMVEESIRIPLIFNQPGRLFGHQHRGEFVDHLDIFRTLAEVAGIDLPGAAERYPGRSFLSLLDNTAPAPGWRDVQFGEYGDVRMVRTARHKLIMRHPDGPHELYDLVQDPRETSNVHADPANAALVARLTEQVTAYFARHADPVKSGLRVRDLPRHNSTEAWRSG